MQGIPLLSGTDTSGQRSDYPQRNIGSNREETDAGQALGTSGPDLPSDHLQSPFSGGPPWQVGFSDSYSTCIFDYLAFLFFKIMFFFLDDYMKRFS